MNRNPTRRKGPRTGAIHVSDVVVGRVMNKILRSPRVKNLGGDAVMFASAPRSRRYQTRFKIEVKDKVRSYATGKTDPLVVTVIDKEHVPIEHLQSGGWMSSSRRVDETKVPREKRLTRAREAIRAIGLRETPARMERLMRSVAFARWNLRPQRSANITLVVKFDAPVRLKRLRNVLRHELAHAMDEGVRRKQMAWLAQTYDDHRTEEERDAAIAASILPRVPQETRDALRRRPPEKRTSKRTSKRGPKQFDVAYYNEPAEVTARIVEILHELSENDAFKSELRFQQDSYPRDRAKMVVDSVSWVSPTFAQIADILTPRNFARVMKAIYDRYHNEPWFPQSTGVLKNRRTSRRRTSRRPSRRNG